MTTNITLYKVLAAAHTDYFEPSNP